MNMKQMLRTLQACAVLAASVLPSGRGMAQSVEPSTPAPRGELRVRRSDGFARGAAIFGVVAGALLLGGAAAIAAADHRESEPVSRGIFFGVTAVSAPLVALGAYTTRRRAKLESSRGAPIRTLGWIAYGGALAAAVAQWYGALHELSSPPALTLAGGALATFSVLPHAFDAYLVARRVEARPFMLTLAPAAGGLGVGARFALR